MLYHFLLWSLHMAHSFYSLLFPYPRHSEHFVPSSHNPCRHCRPIPFGEFFVSCLSPPPDYKFNEYMCWKFISSEYPASGTVPSILESIRKYVWNEWKNISDQGSHQRISPWYLTCWSCLVGTLVRMHWQTTLSNSYYHSLNAHSLNKHWLSTYCGQSLTLCTGPCQWTQQLESPALRKAPDTAAVIILLLLCVLIEFKCMDKLQELHKELPHALYRDSTMDFI